MVLWASAVLERIGTDYNPDDQHDMRSNNSLSRFHGWLCCVV